MSIEQPTIQICDCKQKFTIEPHGDNHVIYFGRCDHLHGLNLATVSELSFNCDLDFIEKCLQAGHDLVE